MARRIEILFEDEHVLAVNKPAGVLSVPGRQGGRGLAEIVAEMTGRSEKLLLVHRLDRDTSGVLVLTKHTDAQRSLSQQFAGRHVTKQYLAIVDGSPEEDSGMICAPLGPHPRVTGQMVVNQRKGRPSETRWRVEERLGPWTLLCCRPVTGRQHQIRVHLKALGLPLLVDPMYGSREALFLSAIKPDYHASSRREERPLINRLTLHARSIKFEHPADGRQTVVEAPLPKDFRATLNQLRKCSQAE